MWHTYTPGGQIKSIKDATGAEIVGYELDSLMQPAVVRSGRFAIGLDYDSLGRKKSISYPNKLETNFSFDNLDRLAEINTPDVGFRSFDYDELSNINQIKSEAGQFDYAYDMNSSVIGAYYKGGEGLKDEKFVWDASGNRLNGSRDPSSNSIRPRPVVINNGLFEDAEPMKDGKARVLKELRGIQRQVSLGILPIVMTISLKSNNQEVRVNSNLSKINIWQETKINELLEKNHPYGFIVDCSKCLTKEDLLNTFADVLKFPDYFGYNWDAFNDCMQDLSWITNKEVHLFLKNFKSLLGLKKDDFETFMKLINAIVSQKNGNLEEADKFEEPSLHVYIEEQFEAIVNKFVNDENLPHKPG